MAFTNDTVTIKNFGPVIYAKIELSSVNVFIGPSASGKSVIAKLIAAFKDFEIISKITKFRQFKSHLQRFNIDNLITRETSIEYKSKYISISIQNGKLLRERNSSEIIKNYLKLRQLSRVDIDLDERESLYNPNVIKEIFSTLITPFIPRINDLDNKSFYKLNHIMRLANSFCESFDGYFYNDNDDLIDESNLYDYPEFDAEGYTRFVNYALRFFELNHKDLDIIQNPVYIPAERILYSFASESLFSLNKVQVNLPKILSDFGSLIEIARNHIKKMDISFLDLEYRFKLKEETISHKNIIIPLANAASGIQTLVPLYLGIKYSISNKDSLPNTFFVIEEPELNLYPAHQKHLIDDLIRICHTKNNKIILTTHSPYILSSLNILLYAYKVAFKNSMLAAAVEEVVPKKCWLNPNEFNAYYVAEGTVRQIFDEEIGLISENELDIISGELADQFDALVRLNKKVVSK